MRKTFLVAWQQFKKIALHWSFLLVVLYPALIAAFLGIYLGFVSWVTRLERKPDSLPAPGVITTNNVAFDRAVGLVDLSGLIAAIPADVTSGKLLPYPDEAAARRAAASGEIAGYYLVPPEYLAEGIVTYFSADNVEYAETDEAIEKLLLINLASADGEKVARRVASPVEFEERSAPLPGGPPPGVYTSAEVGLSLGIAALVYFTVGSVCSQFLNQMAHERQGRVLEVILGALTPGQLLTGKFIGIMVVGLLETGAWLFWVRLFSAAEARLAALNQMRLEGMSSALNQTTLEGLPSALSAPPADIVNGSGWQPLVLSGLVFVGGYFAYVAMAAVFGAVIRNSRQASRISFALGTAAMFPMIWLPNVLAAPDGGPALLLSLLPVSSLTMMPIRIFTGGVPPWQAFLSFALSLAWAAAMLWLAARLFTARLLLNVQPLRAILRGGVWRLVGRATARVSA